MNLLVGALSMGLLLSLLALGVYITYRVLGEVDLTTDGAFGIGAAVAAAIVAAGGSPGVATALGAAAGVAAGLATGVVHTGFGVNFLIAGILTTTALYSVNLFIMGGGDLALSAHETVFTWAESAWTAGGSVTVLRGEVSAASLASLALLLAAATLVAVALDWFFRTRTGLAMRATGDNAQMARAQGVSVARTTVLALLVANTLTALSGALFAQYQGFANIQMGVGMIVTALACIIIGETLLGRRGVRRAIVGTVLGAIVLRLMVAGALRIGLDPNALKLLTAVLVLVALLLPRLLPRRERRAATADV